MIGLAGYMGPWIGHRAAALVICGLDLAEYVKFLAEVRAGTLPVWREWFLLPAATLSLSLTLIAVNRRLAWRGVLIGILLVASLLAALSMLPPAWTPSLLVTSEFRLQALLMAGCVVAIPLSPLLRRMSLTAVAGLVGVMQLVSLVGAVRQFLMIKPAIDRVYGRPPHFGWGRYAYLAGSLLAIGLAAAFLVHQGRCRRKESLFHRESGAFPTEGESMGS